MYFSEEITFEVFSPVWFHVTEPLKGHGENFLGKTFYVLTHYLSRAHVIFTCAHEVITCAHEIIM